MDRKNSSIYFFLYDLRIGGTEKVVIYLANYFVQQNLNVSILTISNENHLNDLIDPRINIKSLNKKVISSAFFPLYRFVLQNKIDVFVANVWPLTILSSFINLISSRTRLVFIDHCNLSAEFKKYNFLFKKMQNISILLFYKLAHHVIAVSKGVKEDLEDKGVTNKKLSVIYNPLHSSSESVLSDIKIDKWLNSKEKKLIAIGQFKKQKNFPNLVEAMAHFYKNYELKPQVLILGDGEEREFIQSKINSHNLQNFFSLPGWVDDPMPFLKESDLFILSSDFEGFGVVIAEALSEGVNVVSTDCPSGPSEILLKGELGYLCKINDAEDLSKSIHKGLLNPFDASVLKNRAKDFSIEKIGKEYLDLIL
ncbi:MAG: glycosyltransferase [SAR86 cluster bacterium]|nr:glycosyltransferase [SAR86 cluster bacterium]